jgi:hypothetical protein
MYLDMLIGPEVRQYFATIGRKGGGAKSPAKTRAVRVNGAKGGAARRKQGANKPCLGGCGGKMRKNGKVRGVQRWQCRDCGKTFSENNAVVGKDGGVVE